MKKTVLFVSLFISFFNTNAHAFDVPKPQDFQLVSVLEDFQVDHDRFYGVNQGNVIVSEEENFIQLNLSEKINCEPGMACIAIAPIVQSIRLPIVNKYKNFCGSVVYVAQRNNIIADGPLETIQVVDYQGMLCKIAVPFITKVRYTTVAPRSRVETTSIFGGELLEVMPVLF